MEKKNGNGGMGGLFPFLPVFLVLRKKKRRAKKTHKRSHILGKRGGGGAKNYRDSPVVKKVAVGTCVCVFEQEAYWKEILLSRV